MAKRKPIILKIKKPFFWKLKLCSLSRREICYREPDVGEIEEILSEIGELFSLAFILLP